MAENIKSRKYYRIHNGTEWDRMHFVTDANSVDANDGDNMETKVGAIKGITTSTSVTEEGYAADATTVAALNESLDNINIYVGTDAKLHFVDKDGADSVLPFSSGIPKNKQLGVSAFYVWNSLISTYKTAVLPAGTYYCMCVSAPDSYGNNHCASNITVDGSVKCSSSANSGTGNGSWRGSVATITLTKDSTVVANVSGAMGVAMAACFRIGE